MLQRQEQREIGIAVEGVLIDAGVDGTETGNKAVIGQIQLLPGFDNLALAAAVELRAETDPDGVTHFNQPPNP